MNKKRRKSAGFQDFVEILFLHGQQLHPYSIYMWFNITKIKKPGSQRVKVEQMTIKTMKDNIPIQ